MKLNLIQKTKAIVFFNFAGLFFLIIFTPYFIRYGVFIFSEEFIEGLFLCVELLALIYIFRRYDEIMRQREDELYSLDGRLQKRERELLSAFQYLGKMNVQFSLIKSLLEKMQIPANKSELKVSLTELLRIICNTSSEPCAALRIVNVKTGRMLFEQIEHIDQQESCEPIKIGNSDLIKHYQKRDQVIISGYYIFYSVGENFYIKAFIVVPSKKRREYSQEDQKLFEAIANQCEMLFLLFNSRYYADTEKVG